MKFIILTLATFFALTSICCIFEAFFYGWHWLSKKYKTQIDDMHLCQEYIGNTVGAWISATLAVGLFLKLCSVL